MMRESVQVALPIDGDGFTSQECPACRKRFKVVFGEGSDRSIRYCPYCRHEERDCWWTTEQVEYFGTVVGKKFVDPLLERFARDLRRANRPGSLIRFDAKVQHGPPPKRPVESETEMPVATFACCKERVKHDGSESRLHCIICGGVTEVA